SGQERQTSDADAAGNRARQDEYVGAVISTGSDQVEKRSGAGPAKSEDPIFSVESIGDPLVTLRQIVAQSEDFDFLRALVTGAQKAQVIEFPALRSPTVKHGVGQAGEMRFAEERRQHGDRHEQEQPGRKQDQGAR